MNSANLTIPSIQFDKVADLYDYYVNVDFDINFFLQEAKRCGGKVLELTCGTGRVSIPLLQAGVDLTCVDYSTKMLSILRRKLERNHLSCEMFHMDMTELSLRDRFDLVFIPFHSFSEIVDRSKHRRTLERIHTHLTEKGRFVCTLQNLKVRVKSINGTLKPLGRFPMDSGGSLAVKSHLTFDAAAQIVRGVQLYEIYDERDVFIDERRLDVAFYLFTKSEFEELVYSTGFEVDGLHGDYDCTEFNEDTSPFMIWRLKKRTAAQ